MKQYLQDLKFILDNGSIRQDRTGTGTIGVFGMQTRYDLRNNFPAVTTKRLAWKAVVSELLWFIEGSTDERRLCEILHKTRDSSKKTIWTDNANSDYWKPHAEYEGDCGKIYGYQWRNFGGIDQLLKLIEGIKKDPYGRRHIISAWNPPELKDMALPPCHALFQFYVNNKNELSCQLYQRSADFPLGIPFNIASYSLLTYMIAQVCDLTPGEFIHTIGDAHIYLNQVEKVKEQISREPQPLPTLWINPDVKDITEFTMDDFILDNYDPHPHIDYPFSV